MRTFAEFLAQSAPYGSFNPAFEAGMYSLVADLEKLVRMLRDAGVPFEIVGGTAVNAHLMPDHRARTFVTRDIDVLVRREDLDRIADAGTREGYTARKIVGGYMLVQPGQAAGEAAHLIFCGERSKTTQPLPHPDLRPEERDLFGVRVPVAPIDDLVRMKLVSRRPKDLVHLQILDEAGLIPEALEDALPEELRRRLREARVLFAEGEPDVG